MGARMEITFQPVRRLSVSWTAYSDSLQLIILLRKVDCAWIKGWSTALVSGRALPIPHCYPKWAHGCQTAHHWEPWAVPGCTGPLVTGSPRLHHVHRATCGQLPRRTGNFTFCMALPLSNHAARSSHANAL